MLVRASKMGLNFPYISTADKMQKDQKERMNRAAGLDEERL